MDLKFTILCDNAYTDQDGRLSIIQTFNIIKAPKYPALRPQTSVVTSYGFEESEKRAKSYEQTIEIVDSGGNKVMEGSLKAILKNGSGDLQFITNIIGLLLPKEGVYYVNLKLNNMRFSKVTSFSAIKTD